MLTGVKTKLIQDCYDILKDPSLIFNILTIAMPKNLKKDYSSLEPELCKQRSSEKYTAVMSNLNKKKSDRQQVVLKGSGLPQAQIQAGRGIVAGGEVIGGDSKFWTADLLKKLNFFNYQRGNNNEAQNIYQESRSDAQVYYQKRKMALEVLKRAMKNGN